ncbi:MAG: homoserine dehydrogenase [Verrucomicrobia bacterium]|nr:homoserine dehydrogenase [Verrucomicrobiota bacterium]
MNLVRIGMAGFGVVGGAVYRHLCREAALLAGRCGVRPVITAVAVKHPGWMPRRKVHLPRSLVVSCAMELAARREVDVVVELMGGCDTARELILASLRAGKPVVTANKALLAEHGPEIFGEANRFGTPIYFEASVAGGIPIIQSLREGLVANRFRLIYGIVNGTCNYILSRMAQDGAAFNNVLREAQELGYAEADPALDIDGIDAAHKATVLASLACGGCVDFRHVHVEGIRHVSAVDVRFAHLLGYEIKLLAIIRAAGASQVEVRVHPTLIPMSNRLATTAGVTNAIVVRGHVVGDIEFSGPGAGGDATASAVLSDIAHAACHLRMIRATENPGSFHAQRGTDGGRLRPTHHRPLIGSLGPQIVSMGDVISRYYLRLSVTDRPGVLAQISSILGKTRIGISSVLQPEGHEGGAVPLILMIHDARNDAMFKAMRRIHQLKCVKAKPVMFRVETFET